MELLNSVSRSNYTMLTFRRSVRPAEDAFDVPVLLDRPQNIFWDGAFQCYHFHLRFDIFNRVTKLSVESQHTYGPFCCFGLDRSSSVSQLVDN